MPDITQLPENVTVTCVHGDALTFATTLGINVTGDTIAAYVYEDTAAGLAASAATTMWLNVGGTWKATTPHINVGGTWKQATPKIRVSGTWKG